MKIKKKLNISSVKKCIKYLKDSFTDSVKEILKGIFIGVGFAIFGLISQPINNILDTNKAIKNVGVGESKDYIDSLIGIPQYETEENGLQNYLYFYNNIIMRAVFDDKTCVAYFITAKDKYNLMNFKNFNNTKLGKDTFTSIKNIGSPLQYEACFGNGTDAYVFYWENHYDGSRTLYDYWILAVYPYGFYDDYSGELILKAQYAEFKSSEGKEEFEEEVNELRGKAKPNTIGCILPGYVDRVNVIIEKDEWINWVYNVKR